MGQVALHILCQFQQPAPLTGTASNSSFAKALVTLLGTDGHKSNLQHVNVYK